MTFRRCVIGLAACAAVFTLTACDKQPDPGTVLDEALANGRDYKSFPAANEDYFADMDGGYKRDTDPTVVLNENEVKGRNNWNVWTGGNDRFWDYMANNTFGAFDLLKIISSSPRIGFCMGPDGKKQCLFGLRVEERKRMQRSESSRRESHLVHAEPQQPFQLVRADQRALFHASQGGRANTASGSMSATAPAPVATSPIRSPTRRNIPA